MGNPSVRRAPSCHKPLRSRARDRRARARRDVGEVPTRFPDFRPRRRSDFRCRIVSWHPSCTRADRSEAAGLLGPSSYMK